jgi:Abi-like protein
MVNNFSYPSPLLNALRNSLSGDRLNSYLVAAANDETKALQLYQWNTDLSAGLYQPLQGLEITLRNAFHRELSLAYGDRWYETLPHILTDISIDAVNRAKKDITTRGKTPASSRVVAELSFGFWVSLLGNGRKGVNNYEMTLWRNALYKSFPNRPSKGFNRKFANRELTSIKELRNRIAHHEPIIHKYNVLQEYYRILDVLSWLCRDTALWVSSNSRLPRLLNHKPI